MNQHLPQKPPLWWTQSLLAIAVAGCATTTPALNHDTTEPPAIQSTATARLGSADAKTKSVPAASALAAGSSAGTARVSPATPRLVAEPPSAITSRVDAAPATPTRPSPAATKTAATKTAAARKGRGVIRQVGLTQEPDETPPTPRRSTLEERLQIPSTLPGANAERIRTPLDPTPQAIDALFPMMPKMTTDIRTEPAPDVTEYSLGDLEQLALANNPLITQATGDIEAAVGAAIQSGAYPNPTIGYEADTVGSAGTRNYQGAFFTQDIITAGKLELARNIANLDLMNKQLDLKKARASLLQDVRNAYFAILVARENLTYNEALVRFTNEVYRIQVEQYKGQQAALYEPMQLRAQADLSRSAYAQAQNNYKNAWKQLAALTGDPNLPNGALVGDGARVGAPLDYETALQYMLSNHTDALSARNLEFQARINVRLQEVQPIPDIKTYAAVQHDFTTPPVGRTTYNLQFGVPVPIFNQNKGGIQKAQGELVRASRQLQTVRLDLSAKLADAFARYENNRISLQYYRDRILPDQARVYRGIYERHQLQAEEISFGDVVLAQQNLAASVAAYVAAMNAQWAAYAEIAGLLQLEDLSELPLAPPAAPEPPVVPEAEKP